MASLPLLLSLLNELEEEQPVIAPFYGDEFGLGVHPAHIHRQSSRQPTSTIRVPLGLLTRLGERQLSRPENKGQTVNVGKDGFQACMNVAQFKPSELSVKVIDNFVVIEAKHEERQDDHGYISRHFVRRYAIPEKYDADKLMSTLSSDGVLTVSIPRPKTEEKSSERIIQIQQTGPAHLNVKENAEEKKEDAGQVEK